jgi:chemotaxis protein CheZ
VIARVVALAATIEQQLVSLLIATAPPTAVAAVVVNGRAPLAGPVYEEAPSSDVVTDQSQVDDLLASLGF